MQQWSSVFFSSCLNETPHRGGSPSSEAPSSQTANTPEPTQQLTSPAPRPAGSILGSQGSATVGVGVYSCQSPACTSLGPDAHQTALGSARGSTGAKKSTKGLGVALLGHGRQMANRSPWILGCLARGGGRSNGLQRIYAVHRPPPVRSPAELRMAILERDVNQSLCIS